LPFGGAHPRPLHSPGTPSFFGGFRRCRCMDGKPVLKTGVRESVGVRFFHLRPFYFSESVGDGDPPHC
jgi:hypothetical protein